MSLTCKVTNKLATTLILSNVDGDTIQLPVGDRTSHNVPREYIKFQTPSLSVASIEGWDYVNARFADEDDVPVENITPEPEPVLVEAASQQLLNGGNTNNGNQRNQQNNPRNS